METLANKLAQLNLPNTKISRIVHLLNETSDLPPNECWQKITRMIISESDHPFSQYPFAVQHFLYKTIYSHWQNQPAPAWFPGDEELKNSNLAKLMQEKAFTEYQHLHRWSVDHYPDFWQTMVQKLGISFDVPYAKIVDLEHGVETPKWFPNSKLNIINSCFNADPTDIAIISQTEQSVTTTISYGDLDTLSNRIANSIASHFKQGDCIAIIMPMTIDAVAIYLGIIKAGCVAVSIADSFSPEEIAVRLNISHTKAVFTQEYFIREGKTHSLYEKVQRADPAINIVLPGSTNKLSTKTKLLRPQDIHWQDFLSNNSHFTAISCDPNAHINILFSSGTTGDPKAIPWNHTTPIKCSSDAYLHHNLQTGDRFCWPTNLGWMMGPWLIFATLINKATMMLYEGVPTGVGFGKFIQDHKITHLGVVPTLVKTWRNSACMENSDWSAIKLFTSTGECSNEEDMLYLMALAQYQPVIEYCGGTEIGGAYITGTVVQPSAPGAFTTAALGLDFVILDDQGHMATKGEVALIPPSIGLSTELLNKDHHHVYFKGMPLVSGVQLRRHGDELEYYENGFYRLHGRADDTMNLSGIKVSSAEIERVLNTHPKVLETAAIAEAPEGGGPSQLIIYTVLKTVPPGQKTDLSFDAGQFKTELQNIIKTHLNPLFKIHEVVLIEMLPRTASNKVMRRILRGMSEKLHAPSPQPSPVNGRG